MNSIEQLTAKDISLSKQAKEIFQKKLHISNTDIPSLYNDLFVAYSTNNDLESLKRAIFIQWYSVSEPIENTGLGELNLDYQKNNLLKVEKLISNGTIDIEFSEMLNHYYKISDWYFDSISNIKSLLNLDSNSHMNILIKKERGLMGKYWESVLNID